MARPGRLELPTLCLEGRCSIQLSYGRAVGESNYFILPRGNGILSLLKAIPRHPVDKNPVGKFRAFPGYGISPSRPYCSEGADNGIGRKLHE